MIRPKPGSPTFAALALIVESPGDLTSADIGAHLRKPAPRDRPFTSPADYAAWRSERATFERERDAWASRLVRRLAEAGYIEAKGPPVIAEWFDKRVSAHGMERALAAVAERPTSQLHRTILRAVALNHPRTVSDVIGSKPSGAVKRAWRDLTDRMGLVVPPAARWPTEKGRAYIALAGQAPV